ncbi:DUF4291 domain-containing protein [Tahibacter amnicola]|uniref:DUF4291 domain-containing protein n=1 Tax=Tahibacter amnicola TaxID=2976241 RepID=A0ABY6BB22_9GAMM|nr:DUF4291 domain-containing protein [Tahibacter amnicola]UXI66894.1 DUF4291 domain-containing protein [Tahibacter amnicola]
MQKQIRAIYDADCIRVYQAYSPKIALPALKAGRFVLPFKMARMTWIKPSFNWMMYRCGFGAKAGQETVLGIDITREGFEWALANAALASHTAASTASREQWRAALASRPVRVQWDPERDWKLDVVSDVRAIQIGLSGEAVERYVNEWIRRIEDVTPIARCIGAAVTARQPKPESPADLERPYPAQAFAWLCE